MTISSSGWRKRLAVSLFPFKVYTVSVVGVLILWHMNLPAYPWRSGFDEAMGIAHDYAAESAYGDFGYIATYAVGGYFICAGVLIVGGLMQAVTSSRRAAIFSIAFGMAAAIIGWSLIPYCWQGQLLVL